MPKISAFACEQPQGIDHLNLPKPAAPAPAQPRTPDHFTGDVPTEIKPGAPAKEKTAPVFPAPASPTKTLKS